MMNNGENVVARCNVCITALQDFFDFLIENKCPNPQIVARVSESLVTMEALSQYVKKFKFHK